MRMIAKKELICRMTNTDACIGFDLDDTVLNKGEWKFRFKSLINKLASEYFVFFATGRSILESYNILRDVKTCIPIICDDGQYIYDREKKMYIGNEYINVCDMDYIFFEENRIEIAVETKNYVYTESKILKKLLKIYCGIEECIILHDVPKEHEYIYKIYYYEKIEGNIDVLKNKYSITRIAKRFGSLTEQCVNKYTAYKKLLENYCIEANNTLFFGDGKNDIELLAAVNEGVAVYNAIPELKAVSKYVLDSNEEFVQILLDLCENKNKKYQ